jgi:hypothetical protein
MRVSALSVITLIVLPSTVGGGETWAQSPTVSIATEYLATLEAPLDPAQSVGSRVIVNVPTGGTIRGPKINGTLIAPAGDWLTPLPDGTLRLDVRATIKTDDGEFILVTYSGVIAGSKELMDRFNNGEVITSKDEYFITAPQFTTNSTKYGWLNQIQAVGKMVSIQRAKSIKYDLFIVSWPGLAGYGDSLQYRVRA